MFGASASNVAGGEAKRSRKATSFQHKVLAKGDSLDDKIKGAVKMMQAIKQPVALLFTGEPTE